MEIQRALGEGSAQRRGKKADVTDEDVVGSESGGGVAGDLQLVLAVDQRAGRKFKEEDGVFFVLEEQAEFFVVEADVPGLFDVALAEAEGLFGVVFCGCEFEEQFVPFGFGGEFIPFDFLAGAEVVKFWINTIRQGPSGPKCKKKRKNSRYIGREAHDESVTATVDSGLAQ